jgi:hypothetical protein
LESEKLLNEASELQIKYERHFKTKFPERIVGWWDPTNINEHVDELASGVKQMRKDVENAIYTNVPLEEIPKDEFEKIIF